MIYIFIFCVFLVRFCGLWSYTIDKKVIYNEIFLAYLQLL